MPKLFKSTRIFCFSIVLLLIMVLGTNLPGALGQLADSSWASFQSDQFNSGRSNYEIPDSSVVLWGQMFYGSATGSPVIDKHGNVYLGTEQGILYAVSPVGFIKWAFNLDDGSTGSAAIDSESTIYVSTKGGMLYAIMSNGNLKWKFDAGQGFTSTPTVGKEGTIYAGTTDSLYALSDNGKLKWSRYGGAYKSPAIDSTGEIYVVEGDKSNIYAASPAGSLQWRSEDNYFITPPVIGEKGNIYGGTFHNKLHALQENGDLKWSYELNKSVAYAPAIGHQGTVYLAGPEQNLYALTPAGSLKWEKQFEGSFITEPIIGARGNILLSTKQPSNHYVINPNSDIERKVEKFGRLRNVSLGKGGTIYGITYAGSYLQAIGTTDTLRIDEKMKPSENSVVNTKNPRIRWESVEFPRGGNEISYELNLSTDSSFSTAQTFNLGGNSLLVKDSLVENRKYYWYVKAFNGKGDSTFSYLKHFWVNSTIEPPESFSLTQPKDSTTELGTQPRFKWVETVDVDPQDSLSYEITIAKDPKLQDTVRNQYLPQYFLYWYPKDPLKDNTRYYWVVEASDRYGASTFSDTLTFVVGTVTNIRQGENIPEEYTLNKPYPNPFNPTTTIAYDLPEDTRVQIRVYNILGRHLRTLVNRQKSAGTYRVQFSANNLPSGQYMIRLTTDGGFNAKETITLIK